MYDQVKQRVPETLGDADRHYLEMAMELSRSYRDDQRRWPFGAIVVVAGTMAGQGVNQVVELNDPTAHAETMALRAACTTRRSHLLEDGVLYSSSEPCPMCLAACCWACIPRIVYAATSLAASFSWNCGSNWRSLMALLFIWK